MILTIKKEMNIITLLCTIYVAPVATNDHGDDAAGAGERWGSSKIRAVMPTILTGATLPLEGSGRALHLHVHKQAFRSSLPYLSANWYIM
eukprot:scaffold3077_cov162-Amphora_coffeaeformis.AAC.6